MAEEKSKDAIPFLHWEGKGGSGITAMHDRNKDGTTSPWNGARLGQELAGHKEAGNTVKFGAVHDGTMIGGPGEDKDVVKPAAKKPAAKPAAKKPAAAKPAAKKAPVKPAVKAPAKKK